MPKPTIFVGAAVALLAAVGVTLWLAVFSGPGVRSVTADGVEVRYSTDAFPDGEPVLAVGPADDFVDAFGIPAPGTDLPQVALLDAPGQAAAEFEIILDADLGALPTDATPAVFTRDVETQVWLPLPTTVDGDRLIAVTTLGGEYAAAVTTAIAEPWRGAQWLRYQAVDHAVPSLACGDEPPIWVLDLDTNDGGAATACAESGDDGELVVRVGVNRPYPLQVSGPNGEVRLATPGLEAVLDWTAGSLPGGDVALEVAPSSGTALADAALALSVLLDDLEVMTDGLLGDVTSEAVDCLMEIPADPGECLVPFDQATADPLTDRLLTAVATAWSLESGADPGAGTAALQDSGVVTVTVAATLDPPPDDAVLLSEVIIGMTVGPSGNPVSVLVGDMFADQSATQWVGCEGEPAIAEYSLRGNSRLTALLGARDYMPDDLVAAVAVLVDGDVVDELTVGSDPVPVDLDLPAGAVLRFEAIVVEGECGPAPDGYLVWGNGALST